MTGSDRIQYHTTKTTIPKDHHHHYDSIAESRGKVDGPFAVLLNSPELAGRIGHLGHFIRFESELPDADRELAILTTARAFDCAYEWATHLPFAKRAGVNETTIDVVAESMPTDDLGERETLVVEYGRELFGDYRLSDRTYTAALDRFDESGVTELTGTMGYYAMIACVLNAFEVNPKSDQPQLP